MDLTPENMLLLFQKVQTMVEDDNVAVVGDVGNQSDVGAVHME